MPTRWKLDTCDCIMITQEGATENDFPTLVQAESICPIHNVLADETSVFNTLKDENPRRNKAFQHLLDNGPAALVNTDPDTGVKVLKPGISIDSSFTGTPPDRVVILTLTGITLTTNQKNTAQTFLNNRFGAGKVTLVNS